MVLVTIDIFQRFKRHSNRYIAKHARTLETVCMYNPLSRCTKALCDAHSPQQSVMEEILRELASLHLMPSTHRLAGRPLCRLPVNRYIAKPTTHTTAKSIAVFIPQTVPCSNTRLPIRSNQGGIIPRIAPGKAFTL